MEHRYDQLDLLQSETNNVLTSLENQLDELQKLTQYYTNEWMEDHDADNNAVVPSDLKRGILSEDLLYNQLVDYHELALRLIKIGTKILELK